MEFGRHLHELWRLRVAVLVCLSLATVTAISLSYRISLLPPGLEPRSLQIAAASTEVLVDTPRSTLTDLRQTLFEIESMTNRSVLLGNVMASQPVLAYIARRAGVSPDAIRAQTPRTPNSPRPLATPGSERKTSDLLRSTNQYRLSIEADPSVPILKVYAQAPTARAAEELANASVDGLRDYLQQEARTQGLAVDDQVRLQQLGRASGSVINEGARLQASFLAFLAVFGLSAAAAIFMARVRRGWREAARAEAAARERRREDREDRDGAAREDELVAR